MTDTKAKIEAFRNDLRAVLEKHGATIWMEYDGDTHGIHGERLSVELSGNIDAPLTSEGDTWLDAKNV